MPYFINIFYLCCFAFVAQGFLFGLILMTLRLVKIRLSCRWTAALAMWWFTFGLFITSYFIVGPINRLQKYVAIPYVEQAALEQCDVAIDASQGYFNTDSAPYYYYRNEDSYFDSAKTVTYPTCRYSIRQNVWECDCGE